MDTFEESRVLALASGDDDGRQQVWLSVSKADHVVVAGGDVIRGEERLESGRSDVSNEDSVGFLRLTIYRCMLRK